ncbi:MAG: hypothetical protein Q8J89_08845 [Caulobacter sp.]|nr:hypothetical protein [Caulobacter sp.]
MRRVLRTPEPPQEAFILGAIWTGCTFGLILVGRGLLWLLDGAPFASSLGPMLIIALIVTLLGGLARAGWRVLQRRVYRNVGGRAD